MSEKQKYETHVEKPSLSIIHNDVEHRLLKIEDETKLDLLVNDIENYMKNNDGVGKSKEEKDDLYKNAIELWKNLKDSLIGTHYNLFLKRKEFQWLTDLLLTKLEYDSNTVFLAIELTEMLGEWKESGTNKDDDGIKSYIADATELNYIYHLIATYKVTGLTKQAYLYAAVLKNILRVLKIVSYYDSHVKRLNKQIMEWAVFDDGIDQIS